MKVFSKIFLVLSLLIVVASCESTKLDLLDNPNAVSPSNAELDLFYNNIQLSFRNLANDASGISAAAVRMVAMTSYTYNANYSPNSGDGIWNNVYANLLPDLRAMSEIAIKGNNLVHLGIAKIMEAHALMTLVDLFGDVPYTEALQGVAEPSPKADPAKDVYARALTLLNEAIAELNKTSTGKPGSDIYYAGTAAKYIKLANTLKLRYYVQTRLVDPAASKAGIDAIPAASLLTDADDFQFTYGNNRVNPNSRHPYYNSCYETGGGTYMSNFYMWLLFGEKKVVDPRLRYYFYRPDNDTKNEDAFTLTCAQGQLAPSHYPDFMPFCVASTTGYWGRDHGDGSGIPPDGQKRTCYGLYPGGGKFDANDPKSPANNGTDGALGAGITPIFLGSWADFLRAEAVLTLGTTGDARALLESGVKRSIAKVLGFNTSFVNATFKPTQADVDAYVAEVLSLYDAAATNDAKLDVVMREYQIATWGNALEMYNAYRRTGKPSVMQPTLEPIPGDYPRSMFYPAVYVNRNAKAVQHDLKTQVFWDKNAPGFIK